MQREWYQKPTLESILTLMGNAKKLEDEKFQGKVANTIRALFHLAKTTNFFGPQYRAENISDKDVVLLMSQDLDVLLIGGLFLQIELIVNFNAKPVRMTFFHL